MKKAALALALAIYGAALLFCQPIERHIDITEVERFVYTEMLPGIPYTLTIADSLRPQDVTREEIEALSAFMASCNENRITGPIEYIYFDGVHSPAVFAEIRQRITGAADKYVCVDFTSSTYYLSGRGWRPLPENCFAGHPNLCWIKMGSFVYQQVPENFCRDCTNLQFAIMWQWGTVAKTAFRGANRDALLYDADGRPRRARDVTGYGKLLTPVRTVTLEKYDGWDYLAF